MRSSVRWRAQAPPHVLDRDSAALQRVPIAWHVRHVESTNRNHALAVLLGPPLLGIDTGSGTPREAASAKSAILFVIQFDAARRSPSWRTSSNTRLSETIRKRPSPC